MRAVITRVREASVSIDGAEHARIGAGFLVLLGVRDTDGEWEAELLAKKTGALRVFPDGEGKLNLSCAQAGGEILVVSNFTLYGDAWSGNRPSFIRAARPEQAEPLYERYMELLRQAGYTVRCGVFGADMQLMSVNDGPVTILIDTEEKERK